MNDTITLLYEEIAKRILGPDYDMMRSSHPELATVTIKRLPNHGLRVSATVKHTLFIEPDYKR